MTIAEAIYLLSAATSLLAAFLLMRQFRASRTPLLLWSFIGFFGLAINNVLVYVDLVLVPETDFPWPAPWSPRRRWPRCSTVSSGRHVDEIERRGHHREESRAPIVMEIMRRVGVSCLLLAPVASAAAAAGRSPQAPDLK